jgi:Holliday junction DNA helicase RuvA
LKDKAPAMMLRGRADEESGSVAVVPRGPEADAVAALVKLGYSQTQAAEAIARTARELGDHVPLDALIRESLRAMVR